MLFQKEIFSIRRALYFILAQKSLRSSFYALNKGVLNHRLKTLETKV